MATTPPNESVGTYRDPNGSNRGSSMLPWIIGLIVLLVLLLLLLWAFGVFGGDDDATPTITDPVQTETLDQGAVVDEPGAADVEEGFDPPADQP